MTDWNAVWGQDYSVASFDIVPTDLTARTNSRPDANGRPCAVIKVYVKDTITATSGSVVGDVIDRGMEKWVYVAHDAKKIELLFKEHMPLFITFNDYNYPSLTGQMTYVMKLKEEESKSSKKKPGIDIKNEITVWTNQYKELLEKKEIETLINIFSKDAVFVIFHRIRRRTGDGIMQNQLERQDLKLDDYINRLRRSVENKEQIKIEFDVVSIDKRSDGQYLYGITLLQHWYDKKYADTGYLYLIWDFNNPDDPKIIGRSWQPADSKSDGIYTFDDIKFSDK